jgi:hypothetical protein
MDCTAALAAYDQRINKNSKNSKNNKEVRRRTNASKKDARNIDHRKYRMYLLGCFLAQTKTLQQE